MPPSFSAPSSKSVGPFGAAFLREVPFGFAGESVDDAASAFSVALGFAADFGFAVASAFADVLGLAAAFGSSSLCLP